MTLPSKVSKPSNQEINGMDALWHSPDMNAK